MNKQQIENNIRLIANINGCDVEKAIVEIAKYVIYEIGTQMPVYQPVIYAQKSAVKANMEAVKSKVGILRKQSDRMIRIHAEVKRLMKAHKFMVYKRAFHKAIKNIDNS